MINALRNAGARFELDHDRRFIVVADGIRCPVEGAEDVFILHEIFAQKVYRFVGPRPTVVWDIGMNVGFAGLFFSSLPNVVAVYGYEPFVPTYQQAIKNFQLNPELARKIQPFNHGLGATQKSLTLPYSYEFKGSVGTHSQVARVTSSGHNETVQIMPTCGALDRIRQAHPGVDIVAKIDCEGAEFEIFESLANSGRLEQIHGFMVEWHDRGPEEIIRRLTAHGFTTFATSDPMQRPDSDVAGMIYSVRGS
jgi:FkbM family methyltransferase